ncbi:MAG: NAD-dependent epimerase/dehydratase family protein [Pseudomonadota bacterium]|nr:NAD-dependent epimerase/dehydratase family protein [Pseudomonadota bacterium]
MSEQVLLAGCGDVGRRVAQCLNARGDTVWALRRQPPREEADGIHWLQADLTRRESLHELPAGITQLVYLPTPDRREPSAYRAVFVDGLRNVLDALADAPLQRALLVSSSAVYGDHAGDWVDEHTPVAPPGFNGEILLEAEQLLASAGCSTIVLRLAGLYGPGRTQLFERLREGKASAPRSLSHWANRIHVDDAAAAIAYLLHLPDPQPLYIGADNTPLPLATLYDHLATLLDAPLPADGPPPAGIGSKRLSNRRLRDSGFVLQWPDAREGYAAQIVP